MLVVFLHCEHGVNVVVSSEVAINGFTNHIRRGQIKGQDTGGLVYTDNLTVIDTIGQIFSSRDS